jgi:hypothetical protein
MSIAGLVLLTFTPLIVACTSDKNSPRAAAGGAESVAAKEALTAWPAPLRRKAPGCFS